MHFKADNVCTVCCMNRVYIYVYMCAFLEVYTHANINVCAFSTGCLCADGYLDTCFMYMCFESVCRSLCVTPNEILQVWKHLRSFWRLSHRIEIWKCQTVSLFWVNTYSQVAIREQPLNMTRATGRSWTQAAVATLPYNKHDDVELQMF